MSIRLLTASFGVFSLSFVFFWPFFSTQAQDFPLISAKEQQLEQIRTLNGDTRTDLQKNGERRANALERMQIFGENMLEDLQKAEKNITEVVFTDESDQEDLQNKIENHKEWFEAFSERLSAENVAIWKEANLLENYVEEHIEVRLIARAFSIQKRFLTLIERISLLKDRLTALEARFSALNADTEALRAALEDFSSVLEDKKSDFASVQALLEASYTSKTPYKRLFEARALFVKAKADLVESLLLVQSEVRALSADSE